MLILVDFGLRSTVIESLKRRKVSKINIALHNDLAVMLVQGGPRDPESERPRGYARTGKCWTTSFVRIIASEKVVSGTSEQDSLTTSSDIFCQTRKAAALASIANVGCRDFG